MRSWLGLARPACSTATASHPRRAWRRSCRGHASAAPPSSKAARRRCRPIPPWAAQLHLMRHGCRGRLLQPVDHLRLEPHRESRALLGPWRAHLFDLVPLTQHPRHPRDQDRAVLAGIQMPPPTTARVVAPRRLPALRARHRLAVVLHVHDHLPLLLVELHVCHSPGLLDVQNPRVQLFVMHGSSVAVLPRTPRPPRSSNPHETRKSHMDERVAARGHPRSLGKALSGRLPSLRVIPPLCRRYPRPDTSVSINQRTSRERRRSCERFSFTT